MTQVFIQARHISGNIVLLAGNPADFPLLPPVYMKVDDDEDTILPMNEPGHEDDEIGLCKACQEYLKRKAETEEKNGLCKPCEEILKCSVPEEEDETSSEFCHSCEEVCGKGKPIYKIDSDEDSDSETSLECTCGEIDMCCCCFCEDPADCYCPEGAVKRRAEIALDREERAKNPDKEPVSNTLRCLYDMLQFVETIDENMGQNILKIIDAEKNTSNFEEFQTYLKTKE